MAADFTLQFQFRIYSILEYREGGASMTSGAFLKTCREKAGISQAKLAELLHRNQSDISKLEKDKKTIDIVTFRDWTKITNQVEVGIAFMYGLDPASILQTVMQISGVA